MYSKMSMKDIKDLNKRRYIVFMDRKTILLKCQFSPFSSIGSFQSESPQVFLYIESSWILNFIWKCKGSRVAQTILKKDKLEDSHYLLTGYTN